MKHGFIKVASATPSIRLADCQYNADRILNLIRKAHDSGVQILVMPRLCLTGSTCQDLFYQQTLLDSARDYSAAIASQVPNNMVAVFGAPFEIADKVYDCAVVASDGKIVAVVPGSDNGERWFADFGNEIVKIELGSDVVPVGKKLIFSCNQMPDFRMACLIGKDTISPNSPTGILASSGATVFAYLTSFFAYSGKTISRKALIESQSNQYICCSIVANSGMGESTSDNVFTGENQICENGKSLGYQSLKEDELLISELDLQNIEYKRRTDSSFNCRKSDDYVYVGFNLEEKDTVLTRRIPKNPFLPNDQRLQKTECEKMFTLQALGLKRRIEHTHVQKAIIGISGGLDSTLALLVTVKTFDMLQMSRDNIICVTMPCFGTSEQTRNNACALVTSLGCTLKEINIRAAVRQHFIDIGQDDNQYDTTYENSQARERTQVLMDIANKENGIVVGTGDLSELALGWATFNGDHMSMYGVNASVPKTAVRAIAKWQASLSENTVLRDTVFAVIDTPVSPELIPGVQNTEDIVGPYELHDFFIYSIIVWGCSPSKVFRLAKYVFAEDFSAETIMKWLRIFYRRFFAQQFKRSCLPDGPQVTEVSLSPRGIWMMPSDACVQQWKQELDNCNI